MMNFLKRSFQFELDTFFQTVQGSVIPVREVTKSAVCRARLKLKHSAFIELNHYLLSFFVEHFAIRKWHGFRLLAIDGFTLLLPNTQVMRDHFGVQVNSEFKPRAMAYVSQLYDCLNRLTLHAQLHSYRIDERVLALTHETYFQNNDLILMDRGYPAFWYLAWILSTPAQFCVQVSPNTWNKVKRFSVSGLTQQIVTLSPTHESKKKCREYGVSFSPILVRLIRVPLDGVEDQILMTSLVDLDEYPLEWFQEVYRLRWSVEENYKHMKSRIEMENFSGKSVESIYQDFYAKVFAMNLTAVLIHSVQDDDNREARGKQHDYQVNATFAVSCMIHGIVRLLTLKQSHRMLNQLFTLIAKTVEPVRPNRTYPRNKIYRDRQIFYPCYKPTA